MWRCRWARDGKIPTREEAYKEYKKIYLIK